jgi:hypothetical protein
VHKLPQQQYLTLDTAREIFDKIIEKFPFAGDPANYIASDATIIHKPNFDSGVIKLLKGEELLLGCR